MSRILNIWIINQYAMPPAYEFRVRNNMMAKYLNWRGFNTLIIGGSVLHNLNKKIDTGKKRFIVRSYGDLKFAHIKITAYQGSGLKRIVALIQFQIRLNRLARIIASETGGAPDVVICDGAPLPLYKAITVAKRFNAIAIKEVRDLWPESLFAYGYLKRKSLLAKYLYYLERKTYEKADALVFSMEGGKDYLEDRSWLLDQGGKLDPNFIFHINNGVDLESFDSNALKYESYMKELFDRQSLNLIYAGSIGPANSLDRILSVTSTLIDRGENIRLIIVGDGAELKRLKYKYSPWSEKIIFTGAVKKEFVPSILKQADLCVLSYRQVITNKYGGSQNKLFEYMAAGKPILSLIQQEYDLISRHGIGITVEESSEEAVENAIINFQRLSATERARMGNVARAIVTGFDFEFLTSKLIDIIRVIEKSKESKKNE